VEVALAVTREADDAIELVGNLIVDDGKLEGSRIKLTGRLMEDKMPPRTIQSCEYFYVFLRQAHVPYALPYGCARMLVVDCCAVLCCVLLLCGYASMAQGSMAKWPNGSRVNGED
jgi:hypothetical protein